MSDLTTVQNLARKHLGNGSNMDSSARLCLADSIALWDDHQMFIEAIERATKSLAYSVGILHSDFITAKNILNRITEKNLQE